MIRPVGSAVDDGLADAFDALRTGDAVAARAHLERVRADAPVGPLLEGLARASYLEFDYGHVPSQAPDGWPPVKSNDGLLARPVYANLLDRVVWVSPDVLVGAAYRGGEPLDSYFVLVRVMR